MAESRCSAPLHLVLQGQPTCDSFALAWEEPMDPGGGVVEQYELRYNQALVDLEGAVKAGGRVGQVLPRRLRFPAPARAYTVRALQGGALYTDVTLYAVKRSGELSVPSARLPGVRTLPMPRELEIELERTVER
jgi:hypothetical protein